MSYSSADYDNLGQELFNIREGAFKAGADPDRISSIFDRAAERTKCLANVENGRLEEFGLPPHMVKEIDEFCKRNSITRQGYLAQVIRHSMAKDEEQFRLAKEAANKAIAKASGKDIN